MCRFKRCKIKATTEGNAKISDPLYLNFFQKLIFEVFLISPWCTYVKENALCISHSIYHNHVLEDRKLFEICRYTNSISVDRTIYAG